MQSLSPKPLVLEYGGPLLLTIGIFILDLSVPTEVAAWLLYAIPLSLTVATSRARASLYGMGLIAVLVVIGAIADPAGVPSLSSWLNRLMGLGIMAAVAALLAPRWNGSAQSDSTSGQQAQALTTAEAERAQAESASAMAVEARTSAEAAAAGAAALALGALIVRQITQPLDKLSGAAQRINAGDLTARVEIQGDDEIAAVARSFNQMADGLQQQEKLRRNLMADVAHELRTPLTGIQGAVEAMQDGSFPADAENLEALHAEVMLLNRLVDDLRILATAEAGQLTLQRRCFDIGELCRRQVNLFQYSAHARRIELATRGWANGPWVYADDQRIGQVLHNLIDNALRHCQEGCKVEVIVEAADRTALPEGSHTGGGHTDVGQKMAPDSSPGGVVVTVMDDGEGIAPSELPHVFDRFYRADRARVRATGGTGLGLSIARQLVLAHGGDLWVQSPPAGAKHGTAFGFALPAAEFHEVS